MRGTDVTPKRLGASELRPIAHLRTRRGDKLQFLLLRVVRSTRKDHEAWADRWLGALA